MIAMKGSLLAGARGAKVVWTSRRGRVRRPEDRYIENCQDGAWLIWGLRKHYHQKCEWCATFGRSRCIKDYGFETWYLRASIKLDAGVHFYIQDPLPSFPARSLAVASLHCYFTDILYLKKTESESKGTEWANCTFEREVFVVRALSWSTNIEWFKSVVP